MHRSLLIWTIVGFSTLGTNLTMPVFSRAANAQVDATPGAQPTYASYEEARDAARDNAAAGRYAAARADLEAALVLAKSVEDKSAAQLRIGETYKLEFKPAQARTAWEKVLEMEGSPADDRWAAEMAIGASFLEDKQSAKARAMFEKVESNKEYQLDPTVRIFVGMAIGTSYQQEENYREARKKFDQVLDGKYRGPMTAPALQTVRMSYAGTYFGEGDYARARAAYDKIANTPIDKKLPEEEQANMRTNRVQSAIEVGNCLIMEKNYSAARIAFVTVLKNKDIPEGLKGQAQARLDELDELIKKSNPE